MAAQAEDFSLINLYLANNEDQALGVVDTFKTYLSEANGSNDIDLESLNAAYKYVPIPRAIAYDGRYGVKTYLCKPISDSVVVQVVDNIIYYFTINEWTRYLTLSVSQALESLAVKDPTVFSLLKKPMSDLNETDVSNIMQALFVEMLQLPADMAKNVGYHHISTDQKLSSMLSSLAHDAERVLPAKTRFQTAPICNEYKSLIDYTYIFDSIKRKFVAGKLVFYQSNKVNSNNDHFRCMVSAVCARVVDYFKSVCSADYTGNSVKTDYMWTSSKNGTVTLWRRFRMPSAFNYGMNKGFERGEVAYSSTTLANGQVPAVDARYIATDAEAGTATKAVIMELVEAPMIDNKGEAVPVFKKKCVGAWELERGGSLYFAPLKALLTDAQPFVGYIN
jgi:hypothetical protein